MMNNIKSLFEDLVHDITSPINPPLFFCLFIEICSNLQILCLSLLPFLENIPASQNKLSSAINYSLSYLKPFKIFDPFDSEASFIVILTLCMLYFVLYISMIGYRAFQRAKRNQLNETLSKLVSFMTLIHSKLIFYFIHCFVMEVMNHQENICRNANSITCTTEKIIIPAILFAFNVTITLFQEAFCYQIHQNKFAYGIKNNLHNFVKFSHKFLVIILFGFLKDSAKILIVFNIFFNIFDLLVLHYKLPFYHLKMLKISIVCSTVSAFCSIVSIYRFFGTGENIFLVIITILPLIIKISIMKLNQTFQDIFCFKLKTPYHAGHLPNLIEDYLEKNSIFPFSNKFSQSALYSAGFLGHEIQRILKTSQEENLLRTTQEIYLKALEMMTRTLQKYPQSEILRLSIAQIYLQVFQDSFKAFDIINKISDKDQSFAGRISVKALSNDFANIHQDTGHIDAQQEKRKISHLSYFAYRHKIQILQKCIKSEIQAHLKIWKNFSSSEIDIFQAITQASLISSQTQETTNYWNKNFEGQEFFYVNASFTL